MVQPRYTPPLMVASFATIMHLWKGTPGVSKHPTSSFCNCVKPLATLHPEKVCRG